MNKETHELEFPAKDLVPGDFVLITTGDPGLNPTFFYNQHGLFQVRKPIPKSTIMPIIEQLKKDIPSRDQAIVALIDTLRALQLIIPARFADLRITDDDYYLTDKEFPA